MSKQTKQTLIGGALILTLATLITKLVGWVYNLFVADLWLHGDGMGYYNVAYSFYNPISILAIAGFPAAIAKIVSGYNAQQRYADIRALKKASSRLFLFIGIAGTLVLALFSFPFANYVFKNPRSVYCMLAIAPSIFFSSLVSARRGYDQGFRNMKTTAASQIIEVLAKTAFGLAACYFSLKYLRAEYAASGTVLGEAIADAGAASALILALAAAATIFSVTVSVAVSYLYYVIRSRRSGEGFTEQQVLESPPAQSQKYYMKLILSIGIPIAVSSLVSSITGMIDTAMLQSIVGTMMEEQPQAIYDAYHGLLDGKQADQVANFLYGSYSAYACKIYNLIPMLTSISLLRWRIFARQLPPVICAVSCSAVLMPLSMRRIAASISFLAVSLWPVLSCRSCFHRRRSNAPLRRCRCASSAVWPSSTRPACPCSASSMQPGASIFP